MSLFILDAQTSGAQTLDIRDAVRTVASLTNTTVTLSGRAELRVTGTGDPLAGSVIDLNSPDAWLLLSGISPSQVASTFLGRVRVNGATAVRDGNVRVVQYARGTVVIPQRPDFSPLEVFDGRYFTGRSARLKSFIAYDDARLGSMASAIGSFRLKRGYTATFAAEKDGTGFSRNYVAQDGDLEVSRLPSPLEDKVRFVRVFPWRWSGKKGIAGNIESGLEVDWTYNWNLNRDSPLGWEYVPIRQTRWWPDLNEDWQARGASHLLGFNEPDRTDQANLTVAEAISTWPVVLEPGLRLGAPAVSDGGLGWLYDFISQADAANLRVDFVPVHYYRCHANVGDPAGTANQFHDFLKGIHDEVKRPLWVTEWNNGANWTSCVDPTFAQQQAAVAAIMQMLDDTPFVERYALYNWVEDVRRVKWDDGSRTAAGDTYRDQKSPLAYRQRTADAGSGTSARFSFDGDAHDGWGHGQDAMLVGSPTFTAGRYGQSIALDGAADYLQVSPRLGSNGDWSFAGWIYWNGGRNWQRIFDFGEGSGRNLFLTPKSNTDTLRFSIERDGTQQQLNAPSLPVGEWTHVAVTLAGDTGKLFVNGARVATNTAMTLNPSDAGEPALKFNYLGKSRFAVDPLFGGRFDDFRFISSALSDAEVAAIAATPPPQFRTNPVYKPDAQVGQSYRSELSGDAIGTGSLTFSKMDGPAWLTVSPSGSLRGTPSATDGGPNNFLVRVTDPIGSIHTATLLVAVPLVTTSIASGEDDAEQAADGSVNATSSDLELVRDDQGGTGNQIVGLRFRDLGIPQGALIQEAKIQFTADETQSEVTTLDFFAQVTDDAPAFAEANFNLGTRVRTSFSVPWQPAPWTMGQAGAAQLTPNLAALVQDVVTRPGWASGNALVFLISGTGHRTANSFNGASASAPRLTIRYTTPPPLMILTAAINGSANDAEQSASGAVVLDSSDLELVEDSGTVAGIQTIGLRFENVTLPVGGVIERATIQFTADEAQTEATTLSIRAQAAANATIFSATANNLTARSRTAASVVWSPPPWGNLAERGPLQQTPDLSAILREITAATDWTSGNAVVILIDGSGHRTATAADKIGAPPATLTVNYRSELAPGTYARWATEEGGVTGPNEDRDHDGYNHFLEFALGLDPSIPDAAVTTVSSDNSFLYLTYTRPTGIADVTYQVEWSEDLTTGWSAAGVAQQILGDNGLLHIVRATVPKGPNGQRYLHLKVSH
jgi:hypothetical protein